MEMEIPPPIENSQPTPTPDGNSLEDVGVPQNHQHYFAPQLSHSPNANGGGESEQKLSAEEVKGVLEIIASTGKFWHDWNELKSMLLFQLKQVLSEYPEARKPDDQQISSLGESYLQLLRNLEEALFNFIEGPPFTLQRLCEILLNAQTVYPNLSKLALALEKNLLVTSTITKCTDSYPPSTAELADASTEFIEDAEPLPQPQPQAEPQAQHQPQPEPQHQPRPEPQLHPQHQPQPELQPHVQHQLQPEPEPEPQPQTQFESSPSPQSNAVENGGEPMTEDRDEVMSEVDTEVDDGMTIDMETFEEIISSSDSTNPHSNNSQS